MLTGHFFPEPVILDVDLEDGLPVAQALSAFITRRPSAKQKEAKISTPNPRFGLLIQKNLELGRLILHTRISADLLFTDNPLFFYKQKSHRHLMTIRSCNLSLFLE
jgi:hypothetical protein